MLRGYNSQLTKKMAVIRSVGKKGDRTLMQNVK